MRVVRLEAGRQVNNLLSLANGARRIQQVTELLGAEEIVDSEAPDAPGLPGQVVIQGAEILPARCIRHLLAVIGQAVAGGAAGLDDLRFQQADIVLPGQPFDRPQTRFKLEALGLDLAEIDAVGDVVFIERRGLIAFDIVMIDRQIGAQDVVEEIGLDAAFQGRHRLWIIGQARRSLGGGATVETARLEAFGIGRIGGDCRCQLIVQAELRCP